MEPLLTISNLHVRTQDTPILRGVDLMVDVGQAVALMGPNGSGKSTLAHVLMGHPGYEVTNGSVHYGADDLLKLKPEERARKGIFLSFQYPQEVAGVTIGHFLRLAYNATHSPQLSVSVFLKRLKEKLKLLEMPEDFLSRPVNEGFSGGEKKQAEILQLAVLEPRLAILDETDSGLDIDAIKKVTAALQTVKRDQPGMSVLVITHYQRILDYLPVDRVAIIKEGRIVRQGTASLLQHIESKGYASF